MLVLKSLLSKFQTSLVLLMPIATRATVKTKNASAYLDLPIKRIVQSVDVSVTVHSAQEGYQKYFLKFILCVLKESFGHKKKGFSSKTFLRCLNLPKIDVEIVLFTNYYLKNAIL